MWPRAFKILGVVGVTGVGIRYYCKGGLNIYKPDLTGKVAVIIGGTAGIGKETARELFKLGATVVITGRDEKKAEVVVSSINSEKKVHSQKSVNSVEFIKSDCSDLDQVKELAELLNKRFDRIDILVNNAGLSCSSYNKTKQGIEMTVGVNYLSLAYLSSLMLLTISKSDDGRIIMVSSRGYKDYPLLHDKSEIYDDFLVENMTSETFGRFKTYLRSKLGQVYFCQSLAKLLESSGITNIKTASVHPGVVRSEIWNRDMIPGSLSKLGIIFTPFLWLLLKSENEGAQTTLHTCLCPPSMLNNGAYYNDCSVERLTKIGSDEKLRQIAWNTTDKKIRELTGHEMFADLKVDASDRKLSK